MCPDSNPFCLLWQVLSPKGGNDSVQGCLASSKHSLEEPDSRTPGKSFCTACHKRKREAKERSAPAALQPKSSKSSGGKRHFWRVRRLCFGKTDPYRLRKDRSPTFFSFPARITAIFGGNYSARDLLFCPETTSFSSLIPLLEVHWGGAEYSKCRQRMISNLVCHTCSYTAYMV